METKFTNDGRKVRVIGKLNSQEYIVQEIFVTDGAEIPSGEQFTTRSLHDKPSESWQEKQLRELEERYLREKGNWERQINDLRKRYEPLVERLKAKIDYYGLAIKNISEESFEMLSNFLCGDVNFVVYEYDKWSRDRDMVPFDEFLKMCDDKIALVSLFGNDKGDLTFRQAEYRDGTGKWCQFSVHKTKEDAIKKLTQLLNESAITESGIETAKKHGIELDKEKVNSYYLSCIEGIEKSIQNDIDARDKQIKAQKEKLKKLKASIK